eukprot:2608897-Amphidinium_carterae.1
MEAQVYYSTAVHEPGLSLVIGQRHEVPRFAKGCYEAKCHAPLGIEEGCSASDCSEDGEDLLLK